MVVFDGALFVLALRIGIRHVREVQCLQRRVGEMEEGEQNVQEADQGTPQGMRLWGRNERPSGVNKGCTSMVERMAGAEPASIVEIMLRDSILYYFVCVCSFFFFPSAACSPGRC